MRRDPPASAALRGQRDAELRIYGLNAVQAVFARRPQAIRKLYLLEARIPQLQRLPPGETVRAFDISSTRLGFDEYDVAFQGLVSHHFSRRGGAVEESSGPFRYVWPAELDLMAELAGLRLRERWADWDRTPFTSESQKHVSVWEKPA